MENVNGEAAISSPIRPAKKSLLSFIFGAISINYGVGAIAFLVILFVYVLNYSGDAAAMAEVFPPITIWALILFGSGVLFIVEMVYSIGASGIICGIIALAVRSKKPLRFSKAALILSVLGIVFSVLSIIGCAIYIF